MKQEHLNLIKQKLTRINTLPLRAVTRVADMLCLQFGNLTEKDSLYRNDQGKAAIKKDLVGEFALHIQCSFDLAKMSTLLSPVTALQLMMRHHPKSLNQ